MTHFFLLLCHFGEILNGYVHGISDRGSHIIDIKVEKYKQIVPDSYIGRHVISVYDTYTVTRWYDWER